MALLDLARCYTSNGWLADSNADGLPDRVDARIVLPVEVTPAEALAAAELAARLGHETMALDRQIVYLAGDADATGGPTIRLDPDPASSRLGEGRIRVEEDGHVAVVGADAAARALALRFLARWVPDVPGGGSLPTVTAWLEEQGRRRGCPVQATISGLAFASDGPEGPTLQEIEAVVRTEADRIATVAALIGGHDRPAWPGLTALRLRVRAADGESPVRIWLGYDRPAPIPEAAGAGEAARRPPPSTWPASSRRTGSSSIATATTSPTTSAPRSRRCPAATRPNWWRPPTSPPASGWRRPA
jgi:hypothetical protein